MVNGEYKEDKIAPTEKKSKVIYCGRIFFNLMNLCLVKKVGG